MSDIDEALVRSLLSEQHPDLAGLELRRTAGGWDNQMWRLGNDLAVRLPRTERAPALLEMEHRWLPGLSLRLPLPVPVPLRIGAPSERFPKTWTVATWVSGEPADRAEIVHGEHAADALARFLAALHGEAPGDAPFNPDRSVPLARADEEFDRHVQWYRKSMDADDVAARMREIWDDALAAPRWDRPPVWIHGDLHPANAIVADGTLAGVIDFGELCAGDPATDLSAAWVLLPDGAAERFFASYARADEAAVRRARGSALLRCFRMIEIGRAGEAGMAGGRPTWKRAGDAALERVLAA